MAKFVSFDVISRHALCLKVEFATKVLSWPLQAVNMLARWMSRRVFATVELAEATTVAQDAVLRCRRAPAVGKLCETVLHRELAVAKRQADIALLCSHFAPVASAAGST
jgi:hypothetical protein